jgi:hypothetical protein
MGKVASPILALERIVGQLAAVSADPAKSITSPMKYAETLSVDGI